MVYEADPYKNDWDGTTQTKLNFMGENLPTGNYYYLLNAKDGRPMIKGNVYLQR